MDKNYQYYNNRKKYGCFNPREKDFNYLLMQNYLSEFQTDEEKEEVLNNLGITDKLSQLRQIINAKVISQGGVPWDIEPTSGNTESVLSSDTIYNTLLKYYTKNQVDNIVQTLWNRVLEQIVNEKIQVDDQLSSESTNPVQNKVIKEILDQIVMGEIQVDDFLSSDSINPVQNRVIKEYLDSKVNTSDIDAIIQSLELTNYSKKTELLQETGRAMARENSLENRIQALESATPAIDPDSVKHIILTQDEYDQITNPEVNTIYIIIERSSPIPQGEESRFGDVFPFILA